MAAFQIGLFILVWALFSDAHAGPIASDLKPIHALNRLAYGPRPGDLKRIKSMGIEQYLKEQLSPEAIPIPPAVPWDQLEKKRKIPAKVKSIRGKLNVPRERFHVTSDGRYRWAGKQ